MSDEQAKLDGESQSLLAELWETPVGRRSVLKAGLASAAALGVGSIEVPDASAARPKKRRRVETTDLHFALGHVRGVSRLTLHANGERIALKRHTKASRDALRRRGDLWQAADLSQLTHHVAGVKLPADRGVLISVRGQRGRREVLVAQLAHAPQSEVIAHARRSHRETKSFQHVVGSSERLARLGLTTSDIRSAQHVAQLGTIIDDYTTAVGLTSCHPNIANLTLMAETNSTLSATPAITELSRSMARLQKNHDDVADFPTAKNKDGSDAVISIPIVESGTVVDHQTTGFTTFRLNPDHDASFARALKDGLIGGIRAVRNSAKLGAVIDQPLEKDPAASTRTWVQPQGVLPQPRDVSAQKRQGAAFQPTVKNPGVLFGTQTVVKGGFTVDEVPLTLYNNWVRWVWVYVQYIGKDGKNLSADPNATFPNTKYSQSLGLLPQVFTVLGVPIWNTNSIDVKLKFPDGAHTARLLFCGLGSNLLDGGWRQYFPADAYLDSTGNPLIAPTAEVLFPSLVTGILTIGLSAFALATDLDIATTWAEVDHLFNDTFENLRLVVEALKEVNSQALALTAAETLAVAVAAGGETYASIKANGGSLENIWSILLALATVIPKIIFNPSNLQFWSDVAFDIAGAVVAGKVLEGLPFVGEVIAVIEAVGDAITLGEVCDESIVAPWVIENEVTLTYPATITISRDPGDSTFPKTAASYQLESKIDGALVFDPLTGSVNPGGAAQPGPLPVSVTAPFGGKVIQWSVVFLDKRGQQVGTGVSAQFTNDDPNNVPSKVDITITELMVPIDSRTSFKRAVTTGWSSPPGATPGYKWSNQVTDEGRVNGVGIQKVVSATVSTLSGVVGVVWEQGDKFYVRGVPIAQSEQTFSMGVASTEGYTRRPFLLFDAFVKKGDDGKVTEANHVLLEPDPSTAAYHVRKVTLDPTTGAPTWDSKFSYGMFPLPVSAAALHSSGRVLAVHTDSGRYGWLKPVDTAIPALAAYSAGSGSQPGLLGSPIAIAVTNPGVVLVLNAAGLAGPELRSFDMNGGPVSHFHPPVTRRALVGAGRLGGVGVGVGGTGGDGKDRLPLVSAGTYLDLTVDGSGQIYVLYYTDSGADPGDYHVDVYTPSGDVLNNHIVGVNVPHLAIDYWRSIFAANYDPLINIENPGQVHVDPKLGVIEPSVSRFDPVELVTGKAPKKRKPKPRHRHRPKRHKKHE